MEFGLSTACLYPQETETTLAYYCKKQVEICELFINTYSELAPAYIDNLRRMCQDAGLRVVSVHPFTSGFEPFMMFTDYERRFEDFLELHRQYFEACATLGATVFVLHGDRRQSVCPDERYFQRYGRLRELGKRYGVRVAQENVVRCRSHSAEFIQAMRRALMDDVSFVLDIKQAVRTQQDVFAMIEAMGECLVHVHLSDHSERADCLPIGEGTLNISKLFSALGTVGFDGSVILELYRENFNEPDELFTSLSALKSIVQSAKGNGLIRQG